MTNKTKETLDLIRELEAEQESLWEPRHINSHRHDRYERNDEVAIEIKRLLDGVINDIGSRSQIHGVSCGKGWHMIIAELDENLLDIDPEYTILQVKEKFGGLRYYARPSENLNEDSLDLFNQAIRRAETLAYKTCEITGGPGKMMVSPGGWVRTIDPKIADEQFKLVESD